MVTSSTQHRLKLVSPFYADRDDGCLLHRYLDERFIERFQQQARNGQLPRAAAQRWRAEDRFGEHSQHLPTLRLPSHRTFYVVSAELQCDGFGNPAVDPKRIIDAGCVIRRGPPGKAQGWQLRDGEPVGWRNVGTNEHDPDELRRLKGARLIAPDTPETLYSGEQTHPLHPLLVEARDTNGKTRKHTLIHGYLPLGGQAQLALNDSERPAQGDGLGLLTELQWPFGCWNGQDSDDYRPTSFDDCARRFGWNQRIGQQVNNGVPTDAFVQLLRQLVERYHVDDATLPGNGLLRALLAQVHFYAALPATRVDLSGDLSLSGLKPAGNLLDWLDRHARELVEWFPAREGESPASATLPGSGRLDLYVTETQAAALREQLVARGLTAERELTDALPVPRFGQAEDDVFFVRPFVRYRDECGCERICWGPASAPFRVAGPLDPEASRPVAIPLPELSDVKRGLARGVSFMTPKSLADAMQQIKPDMGFEKKQSRLGACLGFSLSFSIPIVTICAMILLMIIVQLLNLFLRWLPWAFIKLPRRC